VESIGKYADDIVLLATSPEELQDFNMLINAVKTKVMTNTNTRGHSCSALTNPHSQPSRSDIRW